MNLVWAAGYDVLAIPLAAGPLAAGALAWVGFVLAPAVGAILMSASTIVVALNAQLSDASHELRSPLLTAIEAMINVTLAEPDADTDEPRTLAVRPRDVNQSNIDTVEALLDLAVVSNASLALEPVDITALIEIAPASELRAPSRRPEWVACPRTTSLRGWRSAARSSGRTSSIPRSSSRR